MSIGRLLTSFAFGAFAVGGDLNDLGDLDVQRSCSAESPDGCQAQSGGQLMQVSGMLDSRDMNTYEEEMHSTGQEQRKSASKKSKINTASLLLHQMEELVKRKGKVGLNPEEKHTVYEIEDLINMEILPAIFAAHKESLDELQELYDMILSCQTETSTEIDVVTDMSEWSTKHSETHKECRETEYVWWTEYDKECTEYEEFKHNIRQPELPPDAGAAKEDWVDWLKEEGDYYCPLGEVIREQWEECHETEQNWTKTKEECDETQREWEDHFCAMRNKVVPMCKSYHTCYDSAVARYQERETSLRKLFKERTQEYIAAQKIECLWETWEFSTDPCVVNETMVENCYEVEPNVTNITVIWPELPEPLPCDEDMVNPYPCTEAFFDKYYDSMEIPKELITQMRDSCLPCQNSTELVTGMPETSAPTPAPTDAPTPAPTNPY